MVFIPRDRIRNLISQVTEANLHSVCDEIHHHIRPEGERETVHTIAVSILDEAAGSGHTLVPQYHLAGVCWTIHNLCLTPGRGTGAFPSVSLPRRLNELCQKEFVDASRKLENGKDVEVISSIVLDLVVLIGELYKFGLVEDEVMKNVYLENLRCGHKGSEIKAEALCLLLEFLATRWDMDPTSRNIDVEQYIRSLLDYVQRYDPPSTLVNEIQDIAAQFGVQTDLLQPSSSYSHGSNPSHHESPHAPPQSNFTPAGFPDDTKRHPVYFFHDGDVDLICRSDDRPTIFRVHSRRLIQHSPIMSGLLSQEKLRRASVSDDRPQIPWDDDPVELTTLLEVLYKQVLPFGSNRPPFREFSSLLRLSTKYQINAVRDILLVDLCTTHTPGQDAGGIAPIYHEYFRDPQPHPNEVLNLFHEYGVDFALPFAFYQACMAGIKSLTNTDPSVKLPSVPLSQAVRGFCTLQEREWKLARSILFLDRRVHTSDRCRPLDLRLADSGSPLQDVLRSIRPGFGIATGGILHILDFPNGDNCVDCVRGWNDIKQQAKVELWKSLPEIFGMEPWDEIHSGGRAI
ncbi:hypothetical protein BDM02DRAFT_3182583 [Thelephora ganbajun]|uniref:Uncharacterized protein n=1 Tax=Thelephora ganbajun TaxID=370292 RepID=A0ACB6ZVK9_THEGA|nr:hypothetical protein BDM02DRAFT_3182583 [Thelephora ganbajun]